MPTRRCPFCRERLPADTLRCRHCGERLAEEEDDPDEPRRGEGIRADTPLPRSRAIREDTPPPRRARAARDDKDEDYLPRRRSRRLVRGHGQRYADCPFCGCPGYADKVSFTWWGGILGPSLFNHVQCQDCGRCYNGRSGKDNTVAITIYVCCGFAVVALIGLVIALSDAF
jgi:hypothetical protein